MTKTLKELQEEHPEWCFICGTEALLPINHEGLGCYPLPMLEALIAAKREDEKEIEGLSRKLDETFCEAHRQGSDLRDQLCAAKATIAELDLRVAGYLRDASNLDTLLAEKDAHLSAAQATIAERERDLLVQAGRSDGKNIIIRELEAKLSAAQQAHEETKRQLEDVDRALLAIDRILEPTLRASYVVWSYDVHKAWNDAKAREAGRQSQRAANAAKEE